MPNAWQWSSSRPRFLLLGGHLPDATMQSSRMEARLSARSGSAMFGPVRTRSECVVHVIKPDADNFLLALDVAQPPARQVVYIENTPTFVQIAEGSGIRSILHTDYRSTCAKLAAFGLQNDAGVIRETS